MKIYIGDNEYLPVDNFLSLNSKNPVTNQAVSKVLNEITDTSCIIDVGIINSYDEFIEKACTFEPNRLYGFYLNFNWPANTYYIGYCKVVTTDPYRTVLQFNSIFPEPHWHFLQPQDYCHGTHAVSAFVRPLSSKSSDYPPSCKEIVETFNFEQATHFHRNLIGTSSESHRNLIE